MDSPVEWDRVFGGDLVGNGYSVCETTDGNYVVTGYIENTSGNRDIALMKIDPNGNELWNISFGGVHDDTGYCVRQTSDGGYVITGVVDWYFDMVFFYHVGLLKVDQNGNLLWDKSFAFLSESAGRSVLETSDHGFIIVGWTNHYDLLLVKTDESGNEQWNKTFGGTNIDIGLSIEHGTDGGYLILGNTESFGNSSVWLIKINENGDELWNRTLLGTQNVWADSMGYTSDGGHIISGYFDPIYSSIDAWLMKVNESGVEEWNRTYGGSLDDVGNSVQQTTDGGFVFTGFTGATHFEGPYTFWVVRTDANGVEQWNRSILSEKSGYGSDIQQTTDGMFIITGNLDSRIWILKIADQPPHAKRTAFMIGTISDLETEGVFITFQAKFVLSVHLFPLNITHYSRTEYVTISQNYRGILRPKFIGCLSRT
jgi:hypothetical protein